MKHIHCPHILPRLTKPKIMGRSFSTDGIL